MHAFDTAIRLATLRQEDLLDTADRRRTPRSSTRTAARRIGLRARRRTFPQAAA